jgi:hypothetical protein
MRDSLGSPIDHSLDPDAMAAFNPETIDWRRIDVRALITDNGMATISPEHHDACIRWLGREGYALRSVDCTKGFQSVLSQIGDLLRWKEEFGYYLQDGQGNLNALRDGFDFQTPDGQGVVLELTTVDALWKTHRDWISGLLSIASEHSRYQLALGRRFFTLLVLADKSPMIGAIIDPIAVPASQWNPRFNGAA